MSTFHERIKSFAGLPALKLQLEELKLKLESLEKIKNNVSSENYLSLSSANQKQISELTKKIDGLQAGIAVLKNEIELDSTVLVSENSIVEKEINEQQFLLDKGALNKQEYNSKRSLLQNKISKNKSLLSQDQSYIMELDFYSNHMGKDTYARHSYKKGVGSFKAKVTKIKPKVWITIGIVVLLTLAVILFYKPVKGIIIEKIAWNKAVNENTFESYDLFMSQFPDGSHINSAKIKQEDAFWSSVKKEKSIISLDKYINHYPSGNYLNEAKLIKDTLSWNNSSKEGLFSSYNNYVRQFPEGQFAKEAIQKIVETTKPDTIFDLLIIK